MKGSDFLIELLERTRDTDFYFLFTSQNKKLRPYQSVFNFIEIIQEEGASPAAMLIEKKKKKNDVVKLFSSSHAIVHYNRPHQDTKFLSSTKFVLESLFSYIRASKPKQQQTTTITTISINI